MDMSRAGFSLLLKELTDIGISLSSEKDHDRLLDLILQKAKELTNADGGTLYSVDDHQLKFEIMISETLGIHIGGDNGGKINLPPIELYKENGKPNDTLVATCAVLQGTTINVDDAYNNEQYDFSETCKFDVINNYRSVSFLTVPLTNHENEIIGVLQLLNAKNPKTNEIVSFSDFDQQIIESLAAMAAVTITKRILIDAQKLLFESIIELIASAIDEKSPYTGGHCRRVPELTNMIADAACNITNGPLENFSMTDSEKYALNIAGWLHDCGKITTPTNVVDKGTKLETIFDRIKLIDTRFEVIKRDRQIEELRKKLVKHNLDPSLDDNDEYQKDMQTIDQDREFLHISNTGGEFMTDEDKDRVKQIAGYRWCDPENCENNLLTDNEIENLLIEKGTLNKHEREIINNHISVTNSLLKALPYPKHLANVPEFAGGHHEKMDGTGYPDGLTREEMSVPARMMGIADIFEALTACDRPYRKAMPISKALTILGKMKLDNHIDPDLFNIFIHEQIYMKYAEKFLDAAQIDEFEITSIPGYEQICAEKFLKPAQFDKVEITNTPPVMNKFNLLLN